MADDFLDSDENTALEDSNQSTEYEDLISYVEKKFTTAKSARYTDEARWLQSYRNYRGIYGPDVKFTDAEKSRVFIKVTKTKVLAAFSQLCDVLFSQNRFPIGVEPTTLPEGVVDAAHIDPKKPAGMEEEPEMPDLPLVYGFNGDGKDFNAGDTADTLLAKLGPLENKLKGIENLEEGVGQTQSSITFEPAMLAAKKMEKKIRDQLEESAATKHLRHSAFECVLFGTGIMKGPFAFNKEYPNWGDEGDYEPLVKTIPKVEYTSIWNFYPDPDAINMEDAMYVIERHRMTRSQVRALKKRPFFRVKAIERAIEYGEDYTREWWEDDIESDSYGIDSDGGDSYGGVERFEVIEFWGTVDTDIAKEAGIKLPKELKKKEEIQINCWVCNDEILRLVINPFTPKRIPYCSAPYEINPYSFFGIGLAENMDDTQTLMNGFMRLAVDNAVLSGNLLIEVDESNLVPGQDLTVYPGKIFRRQGGAPGQAIFGTKFPNVSNENMQLFDKARVLADESTGLPSYSYGQTGVQGTGRTASGISMLMGAATSSIRTVIKNIDDYMLRPMGEALFAFNMQFDFDSEIKGDLEVRARGTESFMKNEVRSQRLITFLQIASNPVLAPFAKFPYIMREIGRTMDLDVDKITNNPEEAMRQAVLMQQMQQQSQPEGPPAGANPNDPTGGGGGNIGVGTAPGPGQQGFPTGGGANGGQQQRRPAPQQGASNAPQPRPNTPPTGQPPRLQ
tara:strand:- start:1727 stop:3922 length:2196 start_codon:yes stop_codon:yes gene_type:complete